MKSYVYMLFCHEDTGPIYVKVGMSTSPVDRVLSLKTGCPMRMVRLATVGTHTRTTARYLERDLHDAFRRWRVDGEWFRLTVEQRDEFNAAWKEVFKQYARPNRPLKWQQIALREQMLSSGRAAYAKRNPTGKWVHGHFGSRF